MEGGFSQLAVDAGDVVVDLGVVVAVAVVVVVLVVIIIIIIVVFPSSSGT